MNTTTDPQKLKSLLKGMNIYAELDRVQPTDNLFSMGVLDSLTLIQFVMVIEDNLKMRFENSDINYEQFQSLQQIADLLHQKYQQ